MQTSSRHPPLRKKLQLQPGSEEMPSTGHERASARTTTTAAGRHRGTSSGSKSHVQCTSSQRRNHPTAHTSIRRRLPEVLAGYQNLLDVYWRPQFPFAHAQASLLRLQASRYGLEVDERLLPLRNDRQENPAGRCGAIRTSPNASDKSARHPMFRWRPSCLSITLE